jgi:hypothetical protein
MNSNSSSSDDLNIALARLQAIQWDTLGMGEKAEFSGECLTQRRILLQRSKLRVASVYDTRSRS